MSNKDEDYGLEQAKAQYSSICEMVAALEVDYDRLEELRDERESLVDDLEDAESQFDEGEDDKGKTLKNVVGSARGALVEWDEENGEEFRELSEAAGDCENQDAARDRIQEDPLSVEVRSGWYNPGDEDHPPEEFQILLCTGGPAVRIMGELDEHGQPTRAWMEYQDWGTPWQTWYNTDSEVLLTYAGQFYFGEG